MIVLDASATVDLLFATPRAAAVRASLPTDTSWHAPELLDIEVLHVARRWTLTGQVSERRATTAVEDLAALPLVRHPHGLLRARVWDLRHRCSAYDATYVALAEALACPLLTTDMRLHRAAAGLITVVAADATDA